MSIQNAMEIHQVDIEIFHKKLTYWSYMKSQGINITVMSIHTPYMSVQIIMAILEYLLRYLNLDQSGTPTN